MRHLLLNSGEQRYSEWTSKGMTQACTFKFNHYISTEGEEVFNRHPKKDKSKRHNFLSISQHELCQWEKLGRMYFTQLSLTSVSHHSGLWFLVSMVIVIECERMSKNDSSHIAWKALMHYWHHTTSLSFHWSVSPSGYMSLPVRLSFFFHISVPLFVCEITWA